MHTYYILSSLIVATLVTSVTIIAFNSRRLFKNNENLAVTNAQLIETLKKANNTNESLLHTIKVLRDLLELKGE